jgi:CO dehydrogenase nickel-insertion accessory protein CooC1
MRELEGNGRIVVCDLEAGIGAIVRAGHADVVVVIAEPSEKSIEVARRGIEIASRAGARVVAVANRVRDEEELEAIRAGLGRPELFVVPDEEAIAMADRNGVAPIDLNPDAPGVRALIDLAERLAPRPQPLSRVSSASAGRRPSPDSAGAPATSS